LAAWVYGCDAPSSIPTGSILFTVTLNQAVSTLPLDFGSVLSSAFSSYLDLATSDITCASLIDNTATLYSRAKISLFSNRFHLFTSTSSASFYLLNNPDVSDIVTSYNQLVAAIEGGQFNSLSSTDNIALSTNVPNAEQTCSDGTFAPIGQCSTSSTESSSSSLSTGAKIGIIIGAVIGGLLIIGIIACIIVHYVNKRHETEQAIQTERETRKTSSVGKKGKKLKSNQTYYQNDGMVDETEMQPIQVQIQ